MTDRHSASGKVFDRKQVVCPVTDGSSCQSQSAFKGITTNEKKRIMKDRKPLVSIFLKKKKEIEYIYTIRGHTVNIEAKPGPVLLM